MESTESDSVRGLSLDSPYLDKKASIIGIDINIEERMKEKYFRCLPHSNFELNWFVTVNTKRVTTSFVFKKNVFGNFKTETSHELK